MCQTQTHFDTHLTHTRTSTAQETNKQGRRNTKQGTHKLNTGKGAYGAVYSVIKSHTRETVAVKIISHPNDLTVCPTTVREIGLLKRLKKHANIVNMLDIEYFNNCYCIEFEYLSFDLSQYCAFYSPNNRWMKYCLFQILNGIKYLHKSQICHRDLKPQNILVSRKTMRVKIADFGLARTISVPKANITTQVVTLWYRAPELLLGTKKYNAAIDMWSFGCIMAELFNRKTLFAERSEIAQIFTIFTLSDMILHIIFCFCVCVFSGSKPSFCIICNMQALHKHKFIIIVIWELHQLKHCLT